MEVYTDNEGQLGVDLGEFITQNYSTYGEFVNKNRSFPGIDGLKPVHRRILMGLNEVARGKLTGSLNAVGKIQVMHPYGDSGLISAMYDMARFNVIDSHGAVGVKLLETIKAAHPRYTKVGLTQAQADYWFRLVDYCNLVESDVDLEPESLIVPVPYCLVYGSLNWGFGLLSRTPAFTYESLVNAYIEDNPMLLESQFGYTLDKDKSNLQDLWETGQGKLFIEYDVTRINKDEILIQGSGEIFTPSLGLLDWWVENGKIMITNESSDKVTLRVRRVYNARTDMSEVYQECLKIAKFSRNYSIYVVKDDKIKLIGIRDWLHLTMTKFTETFNENKKDRIKAVEYEIDVLKNLPAVGRLLIEDKSDEEILAQVEGLTEDVLASIKRKSIGNLRKKDTEAEQANLRSKIKSVKSEKAEEVIMLPM